MAPDPYRYFRIEAREILEQLGRGALDLEKGAPSADSIARMLRLAHTLKGAARVVRQPEIAEQAHALEDVFAAARGSDAAVPRAQIDVVLRLLDGIGSQVAALTPAQPDEQPVKAPLHLFRPEIADLDALLEGLAEAQVQLGSIRPRLDRVERARHLIDLVAGQLARPGQAHGLPLRPETVAPLDRPADRARSMIDELRALLGTLERDLASGLDAVHRELQQVGDAAARLRLVPASAVFTFLERAARDVAGTLGRRIVFQGRGGEVRVDNLVLGVVQQALLQVVRNAVAHGIESPEERLSAGKPPDGRVTIAVSHRGQWASFVCTDDGRGVDVAAVRRLLERKGVAAAGPAAESGGRASATDALLRALLDGGISTSGTVTDVAGRGVGLDVVREAAERLGGTVTMRTEVGRGTTVELVVPLSMASFEALIVEADGVSAAVPLEAVRGTRRIGSPQIVEASQGRSILHEGQSLPLLPLSRALGLTVRRDGRSRPSSAFVVQAAEASAAFSVDRIAGTARVVARPLPPLAPAARAVVGAALDARGHPRLVLDPAGLVAEAQQRGEVDAEPPPARRSILVVDDSLTTRMLEQSILESAGYEVELASSGEEGLAKARQGRHALFLVDVEMPGMDGFTFIERARADPVLRDTPSILVTSRTSPEDRQRGRAAGADGYIMKSEFDQGVLLERIRSLVL